MYQSLCVFCSSSAAVDSLFFETAAELGRLIARRGCRLVYGGSDVGLMGAVARAVHQHGGQVAGVIPQALHDRGLVYDSADELLITPDLRQRKAAMAERSDAFIAMPGGFGTLEEIIEVLTLKQLAFHDKPVIFLNTANFYDPLVTLFEHFYAHQFAKTESRSLYHIAPDVAGVFEYLDGYQPPNVPHKWF